MNTANLSGELYTKLESRGIKARVTSIRHLYDLEKEIEQKYADGSFDAVFYHKWLTQFRFSIPDKMPKAESIIITAAPQPQIRVTFLWKGKSYALTIPPTYLYHTDRQVQAGLEEVLGARGFQLEKLVLPMKYLAVSCGLAQYGRNNITYIEGLGSFYRLKGCFTDLPCEEDPWFEPVVMEACADCGACEKSCPTGAIQGDRFLIHAEKCLTYFNEGEAAFPEWVNPSWHNCLVGCMRCQLSCPQNKKFKNWIDEPAVFSETETGALLEGAPKEALAAETIAKLERTGMIEYIEILPRNLGALLTKQKKANT